MKSLLIYVRIRKIYRGQVFYLHIIRSQVTPGKKKLLLYDIEECKNSPKKKFSLLRKEGLFLAFKIIVS